MLNITILSISHQLAPLEIREQVFFTKQEIIKSIKEITAISDIDSCVILSTCNRSEIYITSEKNNIKEILGNYLANINDIQYKTLNKYLIFFENDKAVEHICSVAAGLDSMVLGEPQILGQLKNAYYLAKINNALDTNLEKLFQYAFNIAKKVRTDTKIGSNPVSVAYYAVKLSETILQTLSDKTAILIGAGEMIKNSAQHLYAKSIKKMLIANRTPENAKEIASKNNAEVISLKKLSEHIHTADIVISSTSSTMPIIGKGLIETALTQRKNKPILLIDLSIPRDIEAEVSKLKGVYLYTIDGLQGVVDNNFKERKEEKIKAEKIIKQQNLEYMKNLNNNSHKEIIKTYKKRANFIKEDAVANAIKKLNSGSNAEIIIKELANKITNKLLNAPFQNISKREDINLNQCKSCIPKKK